MIRSATLNDLEQINRIRKQVNNLHVNGEPEIFKSGFPKDMQDYATTFIDSDTKQLFVAENNGVVCAFAMAEIVVKPETPYTFKQKYVDIKELGTDENCQGKGYGKAMIDFIVRKYAGQYSVLQVGTGDSPLTVPFYEKCGFVRSHILPNFFTDNYDHPIYECGVQLVDMIYLQRYL